MSANAGTNLSIPRATTLSIGALLGPGLLLLPGLAQSIAGPAAVLAWLGLLAVSALLATVFAALGSHAPSNAGVAHYTQLGLGPRAGRAVAWCFVAGVVVGAPVVCLIGGAYLSELTGGPTDLTATGLLIAILLLSAGGVRAASTAQLGLVGLLLVVIVIAVVGAAPHAHPANFTPFAPHGWAAVGKAASVIMLSFVGWEAAAPLSGRLGGRRPLRIVIGIAFAVTAAIYLALSVVSVAVLGTARATDVPLADLMSVAVGSAGRALAAIAAVLLTIGSVNAYLTGAVTMLGELSLSSPTKSTGLTSTRRLYLAIGTLSLIVIGAHAAGRLSTAGLVSLPTTLFLVVYLGGTVSAARVLTSRVRGAAVISALAVAIVLGFCGWSLVPAGLIVLGAYGVGRSVDRNQASELRAMVARARRTAGAGAAGSTSVRNS